MKRVEFVFFDARRASQRRDCVEIRSRTAGSRLGCAAVQLAGRTRFTRHIPENHTPAHAGYIQPDARKRLDPRFEISAAADARDYCAFQPAQIRIPTEIWRRERPDMVVSVVPNFNRALFQAPQNEPPGTPFVTILTDFADYPPHFWLEKQDHYVICGTERAYEQALASGKSPEKTFLVSV